MTVKTVEFGKENREVILLLHGGGLSWWDREAAALCLADRYHVVLPILNGHAGSDRAFTTMRAQAQDLLELIDARFGGRVRLIGGLSLGAQVLTEMLALRNDVCDVAVIESASVRPMKLTARLIRPAYELCFPLIKKRWFAVLQFRALHLRPELFERYFADTSRISKADMIAFLTENAAYCAKDALARCSARALVLAGSRERRTVIRSAGMLASLLPHAQLEIVKGCRHGEMSINTPEWFAKRLKSFMEEDEV